MITQEIMYGVKCDRCGGLHENGDIQFHSDEGYAVESACESDWLEEGNKHYCVGCYIMDEESGECKPKPEYPRHVKYFKEVFEALLGGGSRLIEHSDHFELSGTTYNGFGIDKQRAVKVLLDEKLIEFEISIKYSGYGITVKIKK